MGSNPTSETIWTTRRAAAWAGTFPKGPPHRNPAPSREEAAFVAPQLARVTSTVPAGKEWGHELKFDGYRLIAVKKQGRITLFTRNKLEWTEKFGDLAGHIDTLTKHDFVLDGEAVVFDKKGRSRFGDLQAALKSGHQERIAFVENGGGPLLRARRR